jgi:hypothetical protein
VHQQNVQKTLKDANNNKKGFATVSNHSQQHTINHQRQQTTKDVFQKSRL